MASILLQTTRDDLISCLALLNVQLPPKTKLSKEALDKLIRKALDYAQDAAHVMPPGAEVLDIARLPIWVGRKPATEAFQKQTFKEATAGFAYRFLGAPEPTGSQIQMLPIRKALVGLAELSADNRKHFIVADDDDQSAILIRVIDVYKFDERTPVVIVLFMHDTPEQLRGQAWVDYNVERDRMPTGVPMPILEQRLLLGLLENNATRLPKSYQVEREPEEKDFSLAFLLPIAPIQPQHLRELNIPAGCSSCGEKAEKKCAGCCVVLYCSEECQRQDWKGHKALCRALNGATWFPITFKKMELPVPELFSGNTNTVLRWDNNSVLHSEGAMEAVPSDAEDSKPPANIHGLDPFLLKLQHHPTDGASAICFYDRGHMLEAEYREPPPGQDRETFDRINDVMKTKGGRVNELFCWARRVGDWELLLTVDRLPSQGAKW